ncbi:MAG: IS110 family transposase [Caulobacterales bacterium]|nr:IS110 family transposase [Caulobacterales bacterium]
MTSALAAGVDVGRDFLDVAFAPSGRGFRAPNAPAGIALILDRLKRRGVTRVVIEAIGAYGARLVRALAAAGFEVGVVDPRRIRALRIAEGGKAKTDQLDAALIARFALVMTDAVRPVPSPEAQELRALSARRRQLVEMIAMEKTRLKQAIDPAIAQSHREIIATLGAARARVETQIEARVRAVDDGAAFELLQTIPGVGPTIAATLLVDMPELGSLTAKTAASLAGVAPHVSQSGAGPARAHIQGGRSCVRAALYLAAMNAARSDAGYKRAYQALRAAGKPGKVALIAVARKIIVAANAMMKHGQPWARENT